MSMDNFQSTNSQKMTLGKLADKLNLQGEARDKFFKENSLDEFCPNPENSQLPLSAGKDGKPCRTAKVSLKALAESTGMTEDEIRKMINSKL